jgi:hypothetical protein
VASGRAVLGAILQGEVEMTRRPQSTKPRSNYTCFPGTAGVPEYQSVNTHKRSCTIRALVDIPAPGAEGVPLAHGSRFGGHALYIKDDRLHYVYSYAGIIEQKLDAGDDVRLATPWAR